MVAQPGLLHYATYFDRHYLARGLALYRSLVRHSPPFRLWVLCLDEETRVTLAKLRLGHAELIRLAELERADPALLQVKPTRQPVEYYWTCGPAFLRHLFERQPEVGLLTYLDADLYFFGDPTPLYDELGTRSIAIVPHRRSPAGVRHSWSNSQFSVGLVMLRPTAQGLACLGRWREQCLEWCFNRVEPGRFGDQKYLDEWPSRYAGLVVLRHEGAEVAPFNLGRYRFSLRQGQVWVETVPLLYYHFTRLRIITDWLYDPGLWRWGERMDRTVKRQVYVPYVRELRAAGRLIRAVGGRVHPVDNLTYGRRKSISLARMLRHRSCLVVTDRLAF